MAKRGRPPLPPFTEEDLQKILKCATQGVSQSRIAALMGVSESHLKAQCAEILSRGSAAYEAALEQNIATLALSQDPKYNAIIIFMAKVRLGYREDNPPDEPTKPREVRWRETGPGERIPREAEADEED